MTTLRLRSIPIRVTQMLDRRTLSCHIQRPELRRPSSRMTTPRDSLPFSIAITSSIAVINVMLSAVQRP